MKLSDAYMYILGALVVLGFLALLAILIFKGVPEQNSELLYLSVGALIGMASGVINYFYGSSKGSSDKTQIMANGNKLKE
jgi:drug/metabolite transporter (DMT)-like permease